jgi:hypothetical protein
MGHQRRGGELMTGIALLMLAASVAGFGASATPPSLNSSSHSNPFTTSAVTAIASGGSGSYSYAWTLGDVPANGALTINSPASATTTVQVDTFVDGELVIGSIICTVTDTTTFEVAAVEVDVRHRDKNIPLP